MNRVIHGLMMAGIFVPLVCSSVHAADNVAPEGFVSLFNGKDLSGWVVPEGDNNHWKVVDGAIDYDALSEAKGDKSLKSTIGVQRLRAARRLANQRDSVRQSECHVRVAGWHRGSRHHGEPLRLALPDSDSGVYIRGSGRHQINIWCWPIGSGEMYGLAYRP